MGGRLGGGPYDFDNDRFITASVQWKEAKRYGVLIQRKDDKWQLWWLDPGELQRPSATRFLLGGGKAKVVLPSEDLAQVPTRQLLERLGFY